MAAPITHIILATKIFDRYFSDKNKQSFYLGTSFPDIRYLGIIDRTKTHFRNLSLADVQTENSFMAGVKFHSLLDQKREDFIIKSGIYNFLPETQFKTQSVKFLEDILFYEKIVNWNEISTYFNQSLNDEINFGLNADIAVAKEINRVINIIESNLSIKQTINQLYEDFEEILAQS